MPASRSWHLTAAITVPRDPAAVFAFFADASNLGRITPAHLRFTIRTPLPIAMRNGALIDYTIGLWGLPMRWRTLIREWAPPLRFVDEQLIGPYAEWVHEHRFTPVPGGTRIDDHVTFRLPLAPLGEVAAPVVHRMLRRIFAHRQETVADLLAAGTAGAIMTPVRIGRRPLVPETGEPSV